MVFFAKDGHNVGLFLPPPTERQFSYLALELQH